MKNKCLLLYSLFYLCGISLVVADEDPIAKIGWKKIKDLDTPKPTKLEAGSQKPVALMKLENPPVTQRNHAIGGEIRYTNVSGTGFVEMWTRYEDGGRYFSRTLGNFGPMAKLTGSSEWRPFLLPFFSDGKKLPSQLDVNLVLPGGGEVEFRNVSLYQLPGNRLGKAGWWSSSTAGLIGGIGGSILGIWGSICLWFSSRSKNRTFVLASMIFFAISGLLCCLAALTAVLLRQPYAVWYTLTMFGIIMLPIGIYRYIAARKVYLDRELRTISGKDSSVNSIL